MKMMKLLVETSVVENGKKFVYMIDGLPMRSDVFRQEADAGMIKGHF
jgi:hypothetical protein